MDLQLYLMMGILVGMFLELKILNLRVCFLLSRGILHQVCFFLFIFFLIGDFFKILVIFYGFFFIYLDFFQILVIGVDDEEFDPERYDRIQEFCERHGVLFEVLETVIIFDFLFHESRKMLLGHIISYCKKHVIQQDYSYQSEKMSRHFQ